MVIAVPTSASETWLITGKDRRVNTNGQNDEVLMRVKRYLLAKRSKVERR